MKEVYLITVGKLKDAHLESIESDYIKRIKNPSLKIIESKSFSENKDQEADEVIKKIKDICKESSPYIILLAENGKMHDSPHFSKWFYNILESRSEKVFFIIGGAAGHGDKILKLAKEKISLSPLTFPHKIARVLFVEQFYRSQTIKIGHPYHK